MLSLAGFDETSCHVRLVWREPREASGQQPAGNEVLGPIAYKELNFASNRMSLEADSSPFELWMRPQSWPARSEWPCERPQWRPQLISSAWSPDL